MNNYRRKINIKDKVGHSEFSAGGLQGTVIFGIGKHLVEYTDPYGRKSYRTEFDKIIYQDKNIVPIGGYQFVFDKLFNIGLDQETTLRIGDLNDEAPQMKIGVNRGSYNSINYNAECSITNDGLEVLPGINISARNFIFGFMVGDGGSREDNITPIAPDYKNRSLYHPIPFRMSNDGNVLSDADLAKYFGKTTSSSLNGGTAITSYYVKKFDNPAPHIVHVWANETGDSAYVDDTVFSSTSSKAIESYVEINISIDDKDTRGYFTSSDTTPRINEIGLVSGWYNPNLNDYENLRIFTHFTRPSIVLADGDSIEAVYRLYAR